MQEFYNGVTLSWLLGVVVVSFIVNIFSSYFRDIIDKILFRFSDKWSKRSTKKFIEIEKKAAKLAGDKFAQTELMFEQLKLRISDLTQTLSVIALLIVMIIPIRENFDDSIFVKVMSLLMMLAYFGSPMYFSKKIGDINLLLYKTKIKEQQNSIKESQQKTAHK